MQILLVDDNATVRLTLSALLEDAGHLITEAESLAAARTHLHSSFDLILLDVQLGDGFGPSLIPTIRAALPAAKIALLTGHAESVAAAGADLVLAKGDDPNTVLDKIERLMHRIAQR